MAAWGLLIDRSDLSSTELVGVPLPSPAPGQTLVRLSRVGLSTNNLTYAVLGEALRYWDFFPTGVAGTAHVPLWGFADVVASESAVLRVGDRVFGYLPSASHLLITPEPLTVGRFRDAAPHRADLMPIYNEYSIMTGARDSAERENLTALYRPLFMTSFVFEDFAADNDWFGARRLLISSASSKTGYGVAHLAHARAGIEVVGITSPANLAFTRKLGCYDAVITYDDVEALPAAPTLYADVAGDTGLRTRLHRHLAADLTYDAVLGASHVTAPAAEMDGAHVVGVEPTVFLAFDHLRARAALWGPGELANRYNAAWESLQPLLHDHLDVTTHQDAEALRRAWTDLQLGRVDPRQGLVLTFPGRPTDPRP